MNFSEHEPESPAPRANNPPFIRPVHGWAAQRVYRIHNCNSNSITSCNSIASSSSVMTRTSSRIHNYNSNSIATRIHNYNSNSIATSITQLELNFNFKLQFKFELNWSCKSKNDTEVTCSTRHVTAVRYRSEEN